MTRSSVNALNYLFYLVFLKSFVILICTQILLTAWSQSVSPTSLNVSSIFPFSHSDIKLLQNFQNVFSVKFKCTWEVVYDKKSGKDDKFGFPSIQSYPEATILIKVRLTHDQ